MKLYTGEEDIRIEFTIEYQASGLERNTLADEILIKECEINSEWIFDYTESEQEFKVPCSGNYRLEAWGAQGGSASGGYLGGYGAYATGSIYLSKNKMLYINVGGSGIGNTINSSLGGYNGGGNSVEFNGDSQNYISSGGGATHIALESGLLNSFKNRTDKVLMVASGGGGAYSHILGPDYSSHGGSGGGIVGTVFANSNADYVAAGGGTQTSGGVAGSSGAPGGFGQGGSSNTYSSGGGSGWYGGGAAHHKGTGGGSSYIGNSKLIDKVMYCYNCEESSEESMKTISTPNVSDEPISNYAKSGNGYVKITYLGK